MKILVTGGAGYIGSFMVKKLLDESHEVVVVDSLEKGHKDAVDPRSILKVGNVLDKKFIQEVFGSYSFDAVIHFAGYISMKESMEAPFIYFENNFLGLLNILEGMKKGNVKKIIFSSTAGVYGNPVKIPIPEDHIKNPTNPYGESKLMAEKALEWYKNILGINYVALRYFNAAGASLDGTLGELHPDESHIIPSALSALSEEKEFFLYGNDYNTEDGTCVRDYIHVIDLVQAHLFALNKLSLESGGFYYNVGTGMGHSNEKILKMIEEVTDKKLQIKVVNKRSGDADILVADVSKIKKELSFEPKFSDIKTIIQSAWDWHKKNLK